jgi:hypothetical protein
MTILAAIDVVMKLLGALVAAKPDEGKDYARVNELLKQLKTLGEEALGRLLQRMNYIREILTRSTLPTLEAMQGFLNQVIQIIDCDAKPFIPDGWKVQEHQKGGKLEWNPEKIQLYLSDGQKDGRYIEGNKLRKELKSKKVLNACVLDWLLAHPEFIPEEWKGKYIYFWGTIYRRSGGDLCVRCLCWRDGRWDWYCRWLGGGWRFSGPAAVLASN